MIQWNLVIMYLEGKWKKVPSDESTFYQKRDFPHWQDRFHVFTATICHGRCFSVLNVVHYLLFVRWNRLSGLGELELVDISTGWLKKFKVYHCAWTKLYLCEKKTPQQKKTRRTTSILRREDGLCACLHVMCWSSKMPSTWSNNELYRRSISQVVSTMDGEVNTDWEKSHTREVCYRGLKPDGNLRRLTWREDQLFSWGRSESGSIANHARHKPRSECANRSFRSSW